MEWKQIIKKRRPQSARKSRHEILVEPESPRAQAAERKRARINDAEKQAAAAAAALPWGACGSRRSWEGRRKGRRGGGRRGEPGGRSRRWRRSGGGGAPPDSSAPASALPLSPSLAPPSPREKPKTGRSCGGGGFNS